MNKLQSIHQFEKVRRAATLAHVWHRLKGDERPLLPFGPVHQQLPNRSPQYMGLKEIPLDHIVGSVGRANHFDRAFRPLCDFLRQRWVDVRQLQYTVGWQPIIVYQVGNLYFVEDGHHRVSVARELGLKTIEAAVYTFPVCVQFPLDSSLEDVLCYLRHSQRSLPQ